MLNHSVYNLKSTWNKDNITQCTFKFPIVTLVHVFLNNRNVFSESTVNPVFLWQMNQSRPMTLVEETFSYHNEAFSEYDQSTSPFYGKQGIYTKIEEPPPSSSVNLPSMTFNKSLQEPRRNYLALRPNGRPVNRFNNQTVSFHDYVVVREWDEESEENTETTFTTEVEIYTDLEEMNMDWELESDYSDLPEEEFKTLSQGITSYCDDIYNESEMLNTHLKRVNRDNETHNTDHTQVKTDFEDRIHAKPLKTRHQKIAGKHRFKSDKQRIQRHSTESQERDQTVTQLKDTTQAEFSIFQGETYIINPKALVSEADKPIVNYSESFKTDGCRKSDDLSLDPQVSVAESSVQNIPDESNLQTHLSPLTLDPGQNNGSEERLGVETDNTPSSNSYVNENIATNLDDSSPEEESVSNLDTSRQHLNSLHDPHDTQIQCFYDTDTDETNDGRW